jgi:hypothetical protein
VTVCHGGHRTEGVVHCPCQALRDARPSPDGPDRVLTYQKIEIGKLYRLANLGETAERCQQSRFYWSCGNSRFDGLQLKVQSCKEADINAEFAAPQPAKLDVRSDDRHVACASLVV